MLGLRQDVCLPPQGFEYREQNGQCCGVCVQQACVVNTSDSSTHLFYVSSGCGVGAPGPPRESWVRQSHPAPPRLRGGRGSGPGPTPAWTEELGGAR